MTVRVLIDTDCGADDAVAIAWLALDPRVEVVACTTVAGNSSAVDAAHNVNTVAEAAGVKLEVAVGAERPLRMRPIRVGRLVHGADGLLGCQSRSKQLGTTSAVDTVIAHAREDPELVLLGLGPLTNVAQAYQRAPDVLSGRRIIALAGGVRGSITPVTEFNAASDPDALAAVVDSDAKLTLVTREAAACMRADARGLVDALRDAHTPLGDLLARVLNRYWAIASLVDGTARLPDAAAAAVFIAPELATFTDCLVRVARADPVTRGQTVFARELQERIGLLADWDELDTHIDAVLNGTISLEGLIGAIAATAGPDTAVVFDLDGSAAVAQLTEVLTGKRLAPSATARP